MFDAVCDAFRGNHGFGNTVSSHMVATNDAKTLCEKAQISVNALKQQLLENDDEKAKSLCRTLEAQITVLNKLLCTE